MVAYNLAHLIQGADQKVSGPIQDDEALLLFSAVRVMLCRRVLEIGGLGGYSARNFIEAVGPSGMVYTVDQQVLPSQGPNHRIITKDACHLTAADVDGQPLDLVFFDCHNFGAQMTLFFRLCEVSVITPNTVLALHDTNLHPENFSAGSKKIGDGWEHQWVERQMVDDFRRLGYDAISFHTDMSRHSPELPFRHGVTMMRKHQALGPAGTIRALRHRAAVLLAKHRLRSLQGW